MKKLITTILLLVTGVVSALLPSPSLEAINLTNYGYRFNGIPLVSYTEASDSLGTSTFRPSSFKTTLAQSLTEGHAGTTLKVSSITTKDGNTLDSTVLGDIVVLHISPGASNEEIVACTGLTTATRTFTGCTYGYRFDKNSATSSNIKAHAPGETVLISDDDHYLNTQYPTLDGLNVFQGQNWIASSTNDGNLLKLYFGNSATDTDTYIWHNRTTGRFGFATSTSGELAWSETGTGFTAIRPIVFTGGELKLATSTYDFALDSDNNFRIATSTIAGGTASGKRMDDYWNVRFNATTTHPELNIARLLSPGFVRSFTALDTISAYDFVVSTTTATTTVARVTRADGDYASSTMPFVGVALNGGGGGDTIYIQTSGFVTGFSSNFATSSLYYLSNTAGSVGLTSGTVEKVVGEAVDDDTLLLNPYMGMEYISSSAVSVTSGNTVYAAPRNARFAVIMATSGGTTALGNTITIAKVGITSATHSFVGPNANDGWTYTFAFGAVGVTVTETTDEGANNSTSGTIYWYR